MAKKHPPLSETHPALAREWADDSKDVNMVTAGSKYRARWKCQKGHTWEIPVFYRVHYGNNCPYCSNKRILVGYNDLLTTHPDLKSEWADERDMTEFTKGSKKNILWKCLEYPEHTYQSSVYNKVNSKTGCAYCFGRKVFKGFNDLMTTHPLVASEWHLSKNSKTPFEVSSGSNGKVWWLCKRDSRHEWQATIPNRTLFNSGCPYCAGKKVLVGSNDLLTTHPVLAQEWCDEESATDFSAGSHYNAQWECRECRVRWRARIYNRSKEGATSCPKCSRAKSVSAAEQEVHDYIASIVGESTEIQQSNRTVLGDTQSQGSEIDIYLPGLNVAIEFNGLYWHTEAHGKGKFYHHSKYEACKGKSIKLITLWEDDWNERQGAVKSLLQHKLGASTSGRTYARNTSFSEVGTSEGASFLDSHHLQGGNKSAKHYGLREKYTGELIAVMSLRFARKKKELEIKRFATSKIVPGGFTKLLKNAVLLHKEIYGNDSAVKVLSYSHNDHSWGEVYEQNGFSKIHDGTPGYFYVRNNRREFRLNYSPKRFKERADLLFEEGLNERGLASLNGLERIWDCGSSRWEKNI